MSRFAELRREFEKAKGGHLKGAVHISRPPEPHPDQGSNQVAGAPLRPGMEIPAADGMNVE